jgi:hypothetical protein
MLRSTKLGGVFVFGTTVLCMVVIDSMSARASQAGPGSDTERIALARQAARAFCEKFDFPAEKVAELNGEPLGGPISIERDGHRVISLRWLGGGRGDYYVQVELYTESKRIVVYGDYNHGEYGPWVYRKDDGSVAR